MRKTVQISETIEKEFPGLNLTMTQYNQIDVFLSLLLKWNKKFNLTAVRLYEDMLYKHILDSMAIFHKDCTFLNPTGSIIDLGTGAGLPGIVLKILHPDLPITSIEKIEKKITFQQICKSQLNLKQFITVSKRIEDIMLLENHKNCYNYMISRAFTQIEFLLRYGLDLLQKSGRVILWKGERWQKEYQDVPAVIKSKYKIPEIFKYKFGKTGGFLICFELKNESSNE